MSYSFSGFWGAVADVATGGLYSAAGGKGGIPAPMPGIPGSGGGGGGQCSGSMFATCKTNIVNAQDQSTETTVIQQTTSPAETAAREQANLLAKAALQSQASLNARLAQMQASQLSQQKAAAMEARERAREEKATRTGQFFLGGSVFVAGVIVLIASKGRA